jgi:hypothetical protein
VDVQDQYTSASEISPAPAPNPTPTPIAVHTATPESPPLSPAPAGSNPTPTPTPTLGTPVHGAAANARSPDINEGTCDGRKGRLEGSTGPLSPSSSDMKGNSSVLSVEEPLYPPADEVKAKGVSISAAAAALATFSSTTGWLREEVRRRGHPHPHPHSSQTSAPPLSGQMPAPKTLGSASDDLSDSGDLTPSPGPGPGPCPCRSPETPVRPITAKLESKVADNAATHERNIAKTASTEMKTGTKPIESPKHGQKETKKDLIEKLFFSEPVKAIEKDGDKEKSHSSIEHNWRAALDFANKNGAVIPHFLQRKPSTAEAPKSHESASDDSSHGTAARKGLLFGSAPTALSPAVARDALSALNHHTLDLVKIGGHGQLNPHSTPSTPSCSHNAEPKELVRGLQRREQSGTAESTRSAAHLRQGEDLGLAAPLTECHAAASSAWYVAPNTVGELLLRSGDKSLNPVNPLGEADPVSTASECRSVTPFPGLRVEMDASSQPCQPATPLALQPPVAETGSVAVTVTGEGSRSTRPASSPRSASASAGKAKVTVLDEEGLAGREKEKISDKKEWLNKLGEATEKFQNKFSAFKSKRVLPHSDATSTPPQTLQAKTSYARESPPDKPFRMHVDVSKPLGHGTQQPQVFKSTLPQLLVSTHSLPTILTPVPKSPTSSLVVQKRDDTPHYRKVIVGTDFQGQRMSDEFPTLHSRELFSSDHASSPDLRPRSVSDLSARNPGNEGGEDEDAMGRSQRALSVGTLDMPHCNGLTSAMSSNRMKARGSSITSGSSSAFAPTSSRIALRATMTPQERRYTMFRQLQSAMTDNDTDTEGNEGLLNSFTPIEQLNDLLHSAANCGAEVSPNAAVLAFEQQLTGAERSESSFSPGDHCAPAPSRLGVLHLPPSEEAMWAELSQGGKHGKAVLQLYFIGLKSGAGADPDDTRKSVSFCDSFSPAPSAYAISSTQVHPLALSGNSGLSAGAKMVLAASYDLQGAECRLLSSAATGDAAEGRLVSLFGAAPVLAGSPSLPPAAVGFQVLLKQDRGKWTTFLCSSEEECGDWMDAIDNAANP